MTAQRIQAARLWWAPAAVARRDENLRFNFPKMIESGARLVLSTDAGVLPGYSFGWAEHHEMGMYVKSRAEAPPTSSWRRPHGRPRCCT